jgi:hypothetical protein
LTYSDQPDASNSPVETKPGNDPNVDAGTPPAKVLGAARNFAREEFALRHRYARVLQTDEPHPHVHVVLKAISEQGVRLHIQKATLRHGRAEFARHLRLLGVPAHS